MAPLAAARPSVEAVRLPGEPPALRLAVDLKIGQVERSEYDEKTKTFVFVPADASEIAGWRGLDLSVVVRDARGMLHRFEGQRTTVDGGPHEMVVPLGPEADAADASFAYPLDLLAIELLIRIPERYQVPNARVTVGDLASADAADAPTSRGCRSRSRCRTAGAARVAYFGRSPHGVEPNIRGATLVTEVGQPGIPALWARTSSAAGPSCVSRRASIAELAGRRSRSWPATRSSRRRRARSATRSA